MSPISTTAHDIVPTQLRGLSFLALSQTGRVLKLSYTDNAGGGSRGTYTPQSDVPCRVDPVGGSETVVADRIDERTTHRITIPPATVVSASDRFAVDTVGTFEITAVRKRTDEAVRILEATPNF